MTDLWRAEAERWGLPGLYLLCVESAGDQARDPRPMGFDAAVQFPPSWAELSKKPGRFLFRRMLRWVNPRFSHHVLRYDDVAQRFMTMPDPDYPRWPGVTPGFDNTARRRRNATILLDPTPEAYQRWLEDALARSERVAQKYEPGLEGLVFVNAWNEWGEGNHLEPDERYGHGFLQATKQALRRYSPARDY